MSRNGRHDVVQWWEVPVGSSRTQQSLERSEHGPEHARMSQDSVMHSPAIQIRGKSLDGRGGWRIEE